MYILSRRPGGFFNPNMTAAIALIFLFIANESQSARRQERAATASVVLATLVILLSQSRIGMIVLFAYAFFWRSPRALIVCVSLVVAGIGLAFLIDANGVGRLLAKIAHRGDQSSSLRLELIVHGLNAFLDAPLFGKGYRYLQLTIGQSAHNEIVECLANFGLVGTAVIGLAWYLLYWGASWRFLLVCVAPTFMFSHNFFETVSFQTALGLAFAVDASRGAAAADKRTRAFWGRPESGEVRMSGGR
jgi:hypothetical protein